MYGHTLTWTPGNFLIQFLSRLSPDLGMSGVSGMFERGYVRPLLV